MSKYEEGEPSELREEEKPPKKLKIKLEVNPNNTAINKGKEAAVEDDDDDQVKLFSCPICSKAFRSDKAVHGHMNTHPERPWRGKIYSRPITANSDDDHKSGSDLMGALSGGWPAGVRRGRTAGSASSLVIVDDEEELVMGAAYGIMLLATGDERYRILPPSNMNGVRVSEIPSPRKNLEEEGNKFDIYRKSFGEDLHRSLPPLRIDEVRVPATSPPSNKKPKISGYEDERKNQKLDESKMKMVSYMKGISSCGNGNTTSLVGTKKRKRMNNETMESSMMIKSYMCGTCGKSFATPQALGGHTSSSGHSSKTAIKSAGPEQVPCHHFECVKEEPSSLLSLSSAGSHVCKRCKKAFPSGQALGGHQRVHSNKPSSGSVVVANDNNNNGVGNEADDQDEVIMRKPALCLDLNEIPADDSEEEDQ